jgi:hypothetical protein
LTDKPPYGQPCNGCGQCCMNELCPLGNAVFKRWDGPCPALESEGERYACGLVKHPERRAGRMAEKLAYIRATIGHMERELRAATAQGRVALGDDRPTMLAI